MTPKVGTSGGGGQTPLSAGKCSGLSGSQPDTPEATMSAEQGESLSEQGSLGLQSRQIPDPEEQEDGEEEEPAE